MSRLVALAVSLVTFSTLTAGDWPQWRGPKRDAISTETKLLKQWPKDGPPLVWTYKNGGLGFSSFAIQDGKLYTLGTRGDDEIVIALDADKGTELWTAKIGPIFTFKGNVWGDGPRGTPTLDGNILYALGGQGDLVCLDIAKKGAELWRKNLISDFGGVMMTEWGYSESPLVDGDRVLVTPGGEKGLVVALDKKTGAKLWQSEKVADAAPYSSIMPADINGVRQYVQLSYRQPSVGGFVNGIAAKDGKLLWQAPIFKGSSYAVCPTPIVEGNLVYVTSGYGAGCHAFDVDADFKAKDRFSRPNQLKVKDTHGGVVLIGGKIFGHSEGTGWVCQDLATGKLDWNEKDVFETKSGAIMADGNKMLYLLTEDGDVGLLDSQAGKFELTSEFKLPELSTYPKTRKTSLQSKVWNHAVIANGMLYLRDCELTYCYDIRAK